MNLFYYLKKVAKREGATRVLRNPDDKTDGAQEEDEELANGILNVFKFRRALILGGLRRKEATLGADS